MPGRISRSSLPQQHHHHNQALSKPSSKLSLSSARNSRKRKSRNLDAYAIAEKTNPERSKIKQYRLGEVEEEEPRRKKQRTNGDDGDEEEQEEYRSSRNQRSKHRVEGDEDGLDLEEDSDSEPYHLGPGEDDDDSDIDSDDAFESGDEEKFEGFSFRGSNDKRSKKAPKTKDAEVSENVGFTLDEDDEGNENDLEGQDSGIEDDFGDEGVDLATLLDRSDSEEENSDVHEAENLENTELRRRREVKSGNSLDLNEIGGSESEADGWASEDDEDDAHFDMSDDESEDDPDGKQQLEQIITSSNPAPTQQNQLGTQEDQKAIIARAIAAFQSSDLDPLLKVEAEKLSKSIQTSSRNSRKSVLVSAPLPKRQQDRIDRGAARAETNKSLDRWVDTVKHNRRADHLTFPLPDLHAQDAQGTAHFVTTANEKPRTELEQTIAHIMNESGLGGVGGNAVEKQLQGFEELQTNKMPLEEVLARRAELRKQRELMFREEVKARRIKKIKSKAYRRVHRKDAQKAQQKERDMLAAAGLMEDNLSEDEKEANDRRRAEERMGARHKESKWSKSVKAQGRQTWDEEARNGIEEMARRNEELRRRMEGREAESDGMDSDVSSSDEGDEVDKHRGEGERQRLARQMGKLETMHDGEESKLGQLKFMQRADAARKKQNEEDIERLRRDLAGDMSEEEDETRLEAETTIGRKIFGPTTNKEASPPARKNRAEFEEHDFSDPDNEMVPEEKEIGSQPNGVFATTKSEDEKRTWEKRETKSLQGPGGAKVFRPQAQTTSIHDDPMIDRTKASITSSEPKPKPGATKTNGWTTVTIENNKTLPQQSPPEDDEVPSGSQSDGATSDAIVPSNFDLVQSAFGTGEDEAAFAAEKASAASSEDEKFEDTALPGWGSWTGDGISKREKKRNEARNKGRFVVKVADGVKANARKDRNMDKVIISEKRSRKNAKYLASQLPHPYESKTQYERGIRLPIGPEWTTKETFQSQTKPRVLVKPGRAIRPMERPLL